ncbi:hypothetical protein ACWEK5_47110 [Rhodococcus koreensis]
MDRKEVGIPLPRHRIPQPGNVVVYAKRIRRAHATIEAETSDTEM